MTTTKKILVLTDSGVRSFNVDPWLVRRAGKATTATVQIDGVWFVVKSPDPKSAARIIKRAR